MQTDIEFTNNPTQSQQGDTHTASFSATAPGQLRVIKRNGTVVQFDASKIAVAMTKAFLAVEGGTAAASTRVHETVDNLTKQITATFKRRMPSGGTIHIEEIQDQVELILMRSGEQKVARDYVLYRESRSRLRAQKRAESQAADPDYPTINVIRADGTRAPLNINRMRTIVSEACANLKGVGNIPSIAGRSPSYVVRQLNDFKNGLRSFSTTEIRSDGLGPPPKSRRWRIATSSSRPRSRRKTSSARSSPRCARC